LNLGVGFDLPKEQWKDLANCTEEIITGQKSFIDYPKAIRTLAKRYARKIIREQASVTDAGEDIPPDYATMISTALRMRMPGQLGLNMLFMGLSKNLG
jgi:hypothetical protein